MSILITCCLGDHIKDNVKALKTAYPGERIVGIDVRKMYFNHNEIDAFYQVCKCTDGRYVNQVLGVCEKEDVDLIISFSSLDIFPFKIEKEKFDKKGIKIALGLKDTNLTLTANDKFQFCKYAKEKGIKIAKTGDRLVYSKDDIKEFMEHESVDKVVTKQVDSTGAKGMDVLSKEDLCVDFRYRTGAIVQEFLTGDEYSVDCFCKDGEVLFSCVKKNYEMDLGVSIYSEMVNRPDIDEMCAKACKELRLDGLVGFDLKEDENGEVYILECNPRPTATISLVRYAGVNLLKHLVEYYKTGNTSFEGAFYRFGAKIVRYREDYFKD